MCQITDALLILLSHHLHKGKQIHILYQIVFCIKLICSLQVIKIIFHNPSGQLIYIQHSLERYHPPPLSPPPSSLSSATLTADDSGVGVGSECTHQISTSPSSTNNTPNVFLPLAGDNANDLANSIDLVLPCSNHHCFDRHGCLTDLSFLILLLIIN